MHSSASNLADCSATQLLGLYRSGRASPVEAARAVLARISGLDPLLNAFCIVDAEGALASARASEARWQEKAPIDIPECGPCRSRRWVANLAGGLGLGFVGLFAIPGLFAFVGNMIDKNAGVPVGMMLMYGAGLISALLGIGSGVLKIPAMDTALRLPIKVSSATSNFMIGVTAAASAGAYFVRGDIVTAVAGPVALGSVLGAGVGARILMRVPNDRVRLLFVVVLVALGAQMLLQAFGIHLMKGPL